MQKFTRSLTREIEIGGERVAVTLDADGVTLRPVGSRRPPHTITWPGVVCAAASPAAAGADQVAAAVAAIKKGGAKAPSETAPVAPAADHATAPASSGISAALARIDSWLTKHRRGYHAGLLPGALLRSPPHWGSRCPMICARS